MTDREKLIETANELGLEFKGNISNTNLQELVDNAQNPKDAGEQNTIEKPEVVTSPTGAKPVAQKEEKAPSKSLDKDARRRLKVANSKKKALVKSIVTLTNKDPRENTSVTTVPLSVENQFFSVARIVPLDVPVELEKCLIDLAESTMMALHRDEIIKGERTGNKVTVQVKKFAVSYSKEQADSE